MLSYLPLFERDELKSDIRNIFILLAICLLVFLPVLIDPHWGLFTDSNEILTACRTFFSDPASRVSKLSFLFTHADYRGYRPAFHIIPLAVWLFSAETPLGFYIFRLLLFAATVGLSYFNCRALGCSGGLAILASLSWFALASTYEVIYTLDKGEGYLSCLFALVIFAYLRVHREIVSSRQSSKRAIIAGSALLTVAVLCAYSIKETALILTVFGATCCFSAAISFAMRKKVGSEFSNTTVSLWSLITGLICIFSMAVFKLCEAHAVWPADRYVSIDLNIQFIGEQLLRYASVLPVLFVLIGVVSAAPIYLLCRKGSLAYRPDFRHLTAVQLVVVVLAGTGALLSWPGKLMYIWYPLLAFLVPTLAYWLSVIVTKPLPIFPVCLSVSLCCGLPQSLACASFQLLMDDSVRKVAQAIARISEVKDKERSIGVPFPSALSTEIGVSIAAFTANAIQPGFVIERKSKPMAANFFSLIFNCINRDQRPSDLQKFNQSAAWQNSSAYDSDPAPGLATVSFDQDLQMDRHYYWYRDRLKQGDVLVIPFGNVPIPFVSFRGADIFSSDWQNKLSCLPQVEAVPYAIVSSSAGRLAGNWHLGWALLKVKRVYPVALSIEPDGWLLQDAVIALPGALSGRTLKMQTDMPQPRILRGSASSPFIAVGAPDHAGGLIFSIPLPHTSHDQNILLHISATDSPVSKADPRPFLVHLTRTWIE